MVIDERRRVENLCLMRKLKMLKNCLKVWNKEIFGMIELEIDRARIQVNALEDEGLMEGEERVELRDKQLESLW